MRTKLTRQQQARASVIYCRQQADKLCPRKPSEPYFSAGLLAGLKLLNCSASFNSKTVQPTSLQQQQADLATVKRALQLSKY